MSAFHVALLLVFVLFGAVSYYRRRDFFDRVDDLMAVTETDHVNRFWKVVFVVCGVLAVGFYFWFKYMLWKSK